MMKADKIGIIDNIRSFWIVHKMPLFHIMVACVLTWIIFDSCQKTRGVSAANHDNKIVYSGVETPLSDMDAVSNNDDVIKGMELNKENFLYVCNLYDMVFPDIIWAQAKFESGNFTSNIYKTKNNFLGLYNSRTNEYYTFDHWSDCLIAYKKMIQYKYKTHESYEGFLKSLPYAQDTNYIKNIRMLYE